MNTFMSIRQERATRSIITDRRTLRPGNQLPHGDNRRMLLYLMTIFFFLVLSARPVPAGFDEAAIAFADGDYNMTLKEILPLAEDGDPQCQYAMGVLYENGFAVKKDLQQAATWYLKAAEQGNSDAQFNLGAMNERGLGMPVNYSVAARWYQAAAEQGDIDALGNLGVLYQNGQGVAEDMVLALALYNVSVAYAGGSGTQAAANRQALANRMTIDTIHEALQLTQEMLKPDNLKPRLVSYLQQRN